MLSSAALTRMSRMWSTPAAALSSAQLLTPKTIAYSTAPPPSSQIAARVGRWAWLALPGGRQLSPCRLISLWAGKQQADEQQVD